MALPTQAGGQLSQGQLTARMTERKNDTQVLMCKAGPPQQPQHGAGLLIPSPRGPRARRRLPGRGCSCRWTATAPPGQTHACLHCHACLIAQKKQGKGSQRARTSLPRYLDATAKSSCRHRQMRSRASGRASERARKQARKRRASEGTRERAREPASKRTSERASERAQFK